MSKQSRMTNQSSMKMEAKADAIYQKLTEIEVHLETIASSQQEINTNLVNITTAISNIQTSVL